MSMRLPVYELAPTAEPDPQLLESLPTELFGTERPELEESDGRLQASYRDVMAQQDRAGGGIFAADQARLRVPTERPTVVSDDRAYSISDDLLKRNKLTPELEGPFALERVGAGRTVIATQTDGKREVQMLDTQARYGVTVENPGVEGQAARLPLVGGGGKLAVTLGDEGRPVGFQESWRPVAGERLVEAIDRDEAHARFIESTANLELTDVRSFLAYHAAPTGTEQEVLAPVWVFGATVAVDGAQVPMRLATIPATEVGPPAPRSLPQPTREPQPGRIDPAAPRAAGTPYEAATSWIGELGGLGGSQQNAQGFVDSLADAGWRVNFNWGDKNAWESDWGQNDDTWVDAADFVFYTGHADQNGWLLTTPGTSDLVQLTPATTGSATGNPGDRWGRQDLEWLTIAACGPLQDDVISAGGGDVLDRWEGAFDGLHALMGYGAISFDNTEEGGKLAQYARDGMPLIDAWFRTAQEVQPATNDQSAPNGPDVWVGAMYVTKEGVDPRFDHLWDHGPVSADPRSPSTLVCIWTTC